jgi:phosphohistidine phosphatase
MYLYLLRHGIAEEGAWGQPDAERRLTPEGIEKMHREARGMARLGLKFTHVYSSPTKRTLETAEIVCQTLKLEPIHVEASMVSGVFRLGVLQELTANTSPQAHLLFVGHEPDMSHLTYQLSGAQIAMKKGGLACIEVVRPEPHEGVLRWLFSPSHLALLGDTAR